MRATENIFTYVAVSYTSHIKTDMEYEDQRQRRLKRELEIITKDPPEGITAGLAGDNLSYWSASIAGPQGSPYAGGTFFVAISVPLEYPSKPPSIRFLTHIYHPNISSEDGSVFVDVLGDMWCAALTIPTILVSVQSLLTDPNPEDPCEVDICTSSVDDPFWIVFPAVDAGCVTQELLYCRSLGVVDIVKYFT